MKSWICFLITLICIIGTVNAFCDETPVAPDKSKEPVALLYKFAPGESIRYTVSQQIKGTITMPGQAVKNIDAELSSTVKLEYAKLYNDGTIDLTVTMESAAMKSDGKPVAGYTPTKDTFMMPFAITGAMNLVSLDFGSIESMPFLLVFPDKDIAPGTKWMQEIPVKNHWPSKVKLDYTFDKLDGQKALIKLKITTTAGKADPKDAASTSNLQDGSADLVFDMTTGKMISAKGTITSSISTVIGKISAKDKSNIKDKISTTKLDCTFSVDSIDDQIKPAK